MSLGIINYFCRFQIGNSFQANFTRRAEQVMAKAAAIYTRVEATLRDSNNHMDRAIRRIINVTELEIAKALTSARTVLTGSTPVPDAARAGADAATS